MKLYVVDLTDHERTHLLSLVRAGKAGARRLRRARTLLLADEGRTDKEIRAALHTSVATVARTRQRFVEAGLEAALSERPRPGGKRKLTGKDEAFLVALACSEPPGERTMWTMQLLADKLVELDVVDEISDETVRRVLKKTRRSRGKRSNGASPR